jgi:hypothetical protein
VLRGCHTAVPASATPATGRKPVTGGQCAKGRRPGLRPGPGSPSHPVPLERCGGGGGGGPTLGGGELNGGGLGSGVDAGLEEHEGDVEGLVAAAGVLRVRDDTAGLEPVGRQASLAAGPGFVVVRAWGGGGGRQGEGAERKGRGRVGRKAGPGIQRCGRRGTRALGSWGRRCAARRLRDGAARRGAARRSRCGPGAVPGTKRSLAPGVQWPAVSTASSRMREPPQYSCQLP